MTGRGTCTQQLSKQTVMPIMVAWHVYTRFIAIKNEIAVDADSLMQYLFLLYAKYGKIPKRAILSLGSQTVDIPNCSQEKESQVSKKATKKGHKRTKTTKKTIKTKRVKTTRGINEKRECDENLGTERTAFENFKAFEPQVDATFNFNINEHGSTLCSLSEPVIQGGNNNKDIVEDVMQPMASIATDPTITNASLGNDSLPLTRRFKLSINAKTGNLRISDLISELSEDYKSTLNTGLSLLPEVEISSDITESSMHVLKSIANSAGDKAGIVEDVSEVTASIRNTECETNVNHKSVPDVCTINRDSSSVDFHIPVLDSDENITRVDTVNSASLSSTTLIQKPNEELDGFVENNDSNTNEANLDISPTKAALALQRSRRKSKPQKFVSLDDDLSFSDDELNCNSFNLENFDADWLGLDIDETENDMNSSLQEAVVSKVTTKNGKHIYQCLFCNIQMKRADRLKRHVKSVHESVTPFQCSGCSRSFVSQFRMDCHRSLNCRAVSFPYTCQACGLRFENEENLQQHRCSLDRRKPFKCDVCEYKSAACKVVEIHKEIHNDNKKYSCHLCDFSTVWKKSLQVHISKHDGTKSFLCNLCDFSCNDKSNLNQHIKSHSKDSNEICSECGAKFHTKQHLKNHKIIHNKDKKHKCTQCDYRTVSLPNLLSHQQTHLTVKKHSCTHCNKTFSRLIVLKAHILKKHETQKEDFSCSSCDFVAQSKRLLLSHSRQYKHAIKETLVYKTTAQDVKSNEEVINKVMPCENQMFSNSVLPQSNMDSNSTDQPLNYSLSERNPENHASLETLDYDIVQNSLSMPCSAVLSNCNNTYSIMPTVPRMDYSFLSSNHTENSMSQDIGIGVKLSHGENIEDTDRNGHHNLFNYNNHLNHLSDLSPDRTFTSLQQLNILADGAIHSNQRALDYRISEPSVTDDSINTHILMSLRSNNTDWDMNT